MSSALQESQNILIGGVSLGLSLSSQAVRWFLTNYSKNKYKELQEQYPNEFADEVNHWRSINYLSDVVAPIAIASVGIGATLAGISIDKPEIIITFGPIATTYMFELIKKYNSKPTNA